MKLFRKKRNQPPDWLFSLIKETREIEREFYKELIIQQLGKKEKELMANVGDRVRANYSYRGVIEEEQPDSYFLRLDSGNGKWIVKVDQDAIVSEIIVIDYERDECYRDANDELLYYSPAGEWLRIPEMTVFAPVFPVKKLVPRS